MERQRKGMKYKKIPVSENDSKIPTSKLTNLPKEPRH